MQTLRRSLLLALAIELPLALLLQAWGIPSLTHHDVIGEVLAAAHAPGIALLEVLGLCCGYVNSLVISDVWLGPVQRPSLLGLTLLVGANLLVLAGVIFLFLLTLRGSRGGTDAAAA